MSEASKAPQVFSRHLAGRAASEHLTRYNNMLAEMMASAEGKPETLKDITVIEIGVANFPGLISAAMLGEFGAEVIKVEPPEGDPARKVSPNGVNLKGIGIPFLMEGRNKQYITLDLHQEKDRENFKKLVKGADVVIDGLKPGWLDSLQIGYRQLNASHSGLVYVAVSPYGHFTEKARRLRNIPDTDLTAQAESGYPNLIGNPEAPEPYNYPLRAGVWAASYMAAALALAGTLTALFHRRKSGEGQMVDIATNDAISAWQAFSLVWGFTFEMPRVRVGNFDWCLFPYGYYEAKDGFVTVAAAADADFRGLLKIFKRWDLENDWRFLFDRITDDVEKLKGLEAEFKKEIVKHTRRELVQKTLAYSAKAARDKLRGKGFPIIVETRSPQEVLKEEHWKVRQSFIEKEHPVLGKIKLPASVPKMSESPPRVKDINCELGKDNETVFKKFGLIT